MQLKIDLCCTQILVCCLFLIMGIRSGGGKTYVLHHAFVLFEVCKSCEHISSFCSQTILAFYGSYSIYAHCIALFFFR